ncbi:MAG: fatty acid CoA ligase family protein [Thermodesulfobacteriota bacterium]|nr:fatty acid CoA ligase family protein [Thermodesulfobacteriota bacterium]
MQPDLNTNIAIHLVQRAMERPYAPAVIFPHGRDKSGQVSYSHYTYRQLDDQSNRIAYALHRQGIQCGQRTVLMVSPGLDFFAITFALFKLGATPILIDPGMGIKNIKTCLEESQPDIFIGIPKAHLARKLLGWGKKSLQMCFTTGAGWLPDTISLPQLVKRYPANKEFHCYQPEDGDVENNGDTAAILFTSGSTGVPKGAIYTHRNFNAQIQALQSLYNIAPGEIDLCTFPLFALFAPALGMTAVIPDMDATKPAQVNPERIFEAIDDFGITNMFGSPALLRRVADQGIRQQRTLPTLKRIISAGAPVPATVLEQFSGMLNADTPIYTPYGATEALPVCSISSQMILNHTRALTDSGQGICVGFPVDNLEVNIIAIDDNPIECWSDDLCTADGKIGEICVKGDQVTLGYFNRPDSTLLAKIMTADGGYYHRMGDVGYRDSEGKIWFCGRKTHRVQTGDETLFTISCEAVFNTHPQVYRTALVGINSNIDSNNNGKQRAVLCVELLHNVDAAGKQQIIADLKKIQQRFEHTKAIECFLFHPAFPVDIRHNAKIFREKLALWASKKLS